MGKNWEVEELRDLVRGAQIVARDVHARPVRIPSDLLEHAELDRRRWDLELNRIYSGDVAALVGAWWYALARPGEPTSVVGRRREEDGWYKSELTYLNLLHQPELGCVLVAIRGLGAVDDPTPTDRVDGAAYTAPLSVVQHLDSLSVILSSDGDVKELFERTGDEMQGDRLVNHLHPDDRDEAVAMWIEVLGAPGGSRTLQERIVRPDGSSVWVSSTVTNQLDRHGWILAVSHDITPQRTQVATLRASEQELRFLTEEVPVGVFRASKTGDIRMTNPRWSELLGDVSTLPSLINLVHVDDRDTLEAAIDEAFERRTARVKVRIGLDRHVEFRLRGVLDPFAAEEAVDLIGTVDDITATVLQTMKLEASAELDPLTGLTNRRGITRGLEAALASSADPIVVFGDLNEFKSVNDTWGHDAGDRVLVAIAKRLRAAVRPGDIVGRWGGDEFVVICTDIADDDDDHVIARLNHAMKGPISVAGVDYVATMSLGAVRPRPSETAERILCRADAAMYDAKPLPHQP